MDAGKEYIMKNIKLIIMLLFLAVYNVFSAGSGDLFRKMELTPNFSRYVNGEMPVSITEERVSPENIIETTFEYLDNGLVIMNYYDDNPNMPRWAARRRWIFYNEHYNQNIVSQNKINEFIPLMDISNNESNAVNSSFNITESYHEYSKYNRFNITIEYRLHTLKSGRQHTTFMRLVTLVFDNDSKRLVDYQQTAIDFPIIQPYIDEKDRVRFETANYELVYDDEGRLNEVLFRQNNEYYLIKKYYYDGILRTFEQPYFTSLAIPPTFGEIIIYDNQVLKYHVKLYYGRHHYHEADTVEELNKNYFHTIFEYDSNKNEVKQIKYFGDNDVVSPGRESFIINSNILSVDEYGNWTKRILTSELDAVSETNREIRYKN